METNRLRYDVSFLVHNEYSKNRRALYSWNYPITCACLLRWEHSCASCLKELQTFSNTSNSVLCYSSSILSFSVSVRLSSSFFRVICKESWVKPRLHNRDIPSSLLFLLVLVALALVLLLCIAYLETAYRRFDATSLIVDQGLRISFVFEIFNSNESPHYIRCSRCHPYYVENSVKLHCAKQRYRATIFTKILVTELW